MTELKQNGATLLALSSLFAKNCDKQNNRFILCKAENEHPAHCADIGKQVTACSLDVVAKVEKVCQKELNDFAGCLNTKNLEFKQCRAPISSKQEQEKFHACLAKHNL